ncbi:zinc finger protein 467-like protein [Leptotrombidium deliense]|uniref:Zinc finger protein 467-like protein n=1 Tax=Leptotrombidium deliense TaxID=299467 RepID=A0A443RQG0_9ACAR|nr:zinc finger protein 467-like protein [Leptotrombidium deliense]
MFDLHIRCVHLREKPHQCKICEKYFSTKTNLSQHIRAVHKKEKRFQCEEYKKWVFQKSNLEKHIRQMHSMYIVLETLFA